jgi:hypothetical protein
MFRARRIAAALFATLAIAPVAEAWGPLGHSVVAELAQRHLSPAAKAEMEHLLALDHTTSLADIASWPDEIRNDPNQQALWKETRPLHYIDFRDPTVCMCHRAIARMASASSRRFRIMWPS